MHTKHNLYNTKDLGFYYFSHLTEEPEGLGLLTQSYRANEEQSKDLISEMILRQDLSVALLVKQL